MTFSPYRHAAKEDRRGNTGFQGSSLQGAGTQYEHCFWLNDYIFSMLFWGYMLPANFDDVKYSSYNCLLFGCN